MPHNRYRTHFEPIEMSGPRHSMERRQVRRRGTRNVPLVEPQRQTLRLLAAAADVVEHRERVDAMQLSSVYRRYREIIEANSHGDVIVRPIYREFIDLTSPVARNFPPHPSEAEFRSQSQVSEASGSRANSTTFPPRGTGNTQRLVAPLCIPLKHKSQDMRNADDLDDRCEICYKSFPDSLYLPCQHFSAHYACSLRWIHRRLLDGQKPTCIICRADIETMYQVRRA